MLGRIKTILLALAAGTAALGAAGPALKAAGDEDPVTVFAAASTTDAMREVGRAYRDGGGSPTRFSFAASSTLARQIEAGAPAEIVLLANREWMDYLAARKLVLRGTRQTPIGNRLVLVAPQGVDGPVPVDSPDRILARLGDGGRLAVGDPEHVPAGIYAAQAMRHLGLWDALAPRLARTDNVRAALALVERGEAPLGIVYATDAALVRSVEVVARFPAESHAPIIYPMAIVMGGDRPAVRDFHAFLTGAEALAIFERHGFDVGG